MRCDRELIALKTQTLETLAKQFQRPPAAILEGDEIRTFDQTEGKMSDHDKQCWPAANIQRQLRADEALIKIVRAKGVSREPQAAGHSGEIRGHQAPKTKEK
jgi:hypothetical protein